MLGLGSLNAAMSCLGRDDVQGAETNAPALAFGELLAGRPRLEWTVLVDALPLFERHLSSAQENDTVDTMVIAAKHIVEGTSAEDELEAFVDPKV